jgi:ADP-ribosyl-[dinitrogen reductase] hydrolase
MAEYLAWYRSLPFDMGATTATGLEAGIEAHGGSIHEGMWRTAAAKNTDSKANGALMRSAPLGIWGWRLREEDLCAAASADSRLTHPNPTCQHASAVYCLAIRHLVLNPGDDTGAFGTAKQWAGRLDAREIVDWLGLPEDDVDVAYHQRASRDAARWWLH